MGVKWKEKGEVRERSYTASVCDIMIMVERSATNWCIGLTSIPLSAYRRSIKT